jgi:hypothetical protein
VPRPTQTAGADTRPLVGGDSVIGTALLSATVLPPAAHAVGNQLHGDRLAPHVVHAERLESAYDPVLHHAVVRRAGNAAPILVAVIAALARDRGNLANRRLDPLCVDAGIGLFAGRQRKADVILIGDEEVLAVLGQAERTSEDWTWSLAPPAWRRSGALKEDSTSIIDGARADASTKIESCGRSHLGHAWFSRDSQQLISPQP